MRSLTTCALRPFNSRRSRWSAHCRLIKAVVAYTLANSHQNPSAGRTILVIIRGMVSDPVLVAPGSLQTTRVAQRNCENESLEKLMKREADLIRARLKAPRA